MTATERTTVPENRSESLVPHHFDDVVRQLGGQVVRLGRGRGWLKPLAVDALGTVAEPGGAS